MKTLQRVWKALGMHCELPGDEVQPDLRVADLVVDSLNMLEISLALDKEFETAIPESELRRAETVADLADLADAHRASTG